MEASNMSYRTEYLGRCTLMLHSGVYAGDGSNAGVRERVESSDLILHIGAVKSDFNTAVRANHHLPRSSPY